VAARKIVCKIIIFALIFHQTTPCLAQLEFSTEDYMIGVGDVLQLNVLQEPELDGSLTVRPDGTVAIPRVGAVGVADLTVSEAEEIIRQKLRLFDPSINDVSLTVTEYNALRIYVLGAVATPGPHTFTSSPTLWDAIRVAGGPLDSANLNLVRLVRQLDGITEMSTYNLSAVRTGQGDLPDVVLGPGDTVFVPVREGAAQVPADIGVQVFGNVVTPSTVHLTEPTRLLTILMMAGSPLVDSKLDEVWWVHRESNNQYLANRVNLELYLEKGSLAGNPLVYPGDTIHVPQRKPSQFLAAIGVFLGIALTVSTLALTINRINE